MTQIHAVGLENLENH